MGAARVGAELRAARQRLGWAAAGRGARAAHPAAYLEAIEEGRLSDLPGNAYAVGFVRTYATSLGLDPDEVARRFRAEAQEINQQDRADLPGARAAARRARGGGGAAGHADRGRRLCRLVSLLRSSDERA